MVITQVKIPQEKGDDRCLSLCYCYFFQYLLQKADPSVAVPEDLRHVLMHLSSGFLVE